MAWSNNGDPKGITNKEQILSKVRNAIIEKPEALFEDIDHISDTGVPISEEYGPFVTFAQHFKESGGIFIYLESESEFAECLKQLVPENGWEPLWCTSPDIQKILDRRGIPYTEDPTRPANHKLASITGCECLVAKTGSVIVSDALTRSRKAYATPDIHLVLATSEQIVDSMKEAFLKIRGKYADENPSQIVIITGPSCTSDIEQIEVTGVSGARQIAVLLLDE